MKKIVHSTIAFKMLFKGILMISVLCIPLLPQAIAQTKGRHEGRQYGQRGQNKSGRRPIRVARLVLNVTSPNGQSLSYQNPDGTIGTTGPVWGHISVYDMEVRDNYEQPYGAAHPHELFSNINSPSFPRPNDNTGVVETITIQPNGGAGGAIWRDLANIQDSINYLQHYSTAYDPNTVVIGFDQSWEVVPPAYDPGSKVETYNGHIPGAISLSTVHHIHKKKGWVVGPDGHATELERINIHR